MCWSVSGCVNSCAGDAASCGEVSCYFKSACCEDILLCWVHALGYKDVFFKITWGVIEFMKTFIGAWGFSNFIVICICAKMFFECLEILFCA